MPERITIGPVIERVQAVKTPIEIGTSQRRVEVKLTPAKGPELDTTQARIEVSTTQQQISLNIQQKQAVIQFGGSLSPSQIAPPGGSTDLTWYATASNTAMAPNSGYICASLSLQRLTLPGDASLGDRVVIAAGTSTLFRVEQGEGQKVRFNDSTTTLGATGRVDSLSYGASLELVYAGAGAWFTRSSNGNFEVA